MALGRALKQSYFGRVIHPAQERQTKDGKTFLTFTLYVDKLVKNKEEAESARISCSYTPISTPDPVGIMLANIFNKEDPDQGGLSGEQYKSVEVLVEGTPRFSQAVVDVDGEPTAIQNAYYVNLDYCSVLVTDNRVLELYRGEFSEKSGQKQVTQTAAKKQVAEQPTVAPSKKKKTVIEIDAKEEVEEEVTASEAADKVLGNDEEEAHRTSYEVGDIIEHNGIHYKFKGGNAADVTSWQQIATPSIPPFAQAPVAKKEVAEAKVVTKKVVTKTNPPQQMVKKKTIGLKQIMDEPEMDDSAPVDETELNL